MNWFVIALLLAYTLTPSSQAADLETQQCSENLEPTESAAPVYPATPMATNLYGWVLVKFTVTETGRVASPAVIKSSSRVFEYSALTAIREFKYPKQEFRCIHENRFEYIVERTPSDT